MMRVGLGLLLIGVMMLVLRASTGSHVAPDGTLVEPFYLEALGKIAVLTGSALTVICGALRFLRPG